MSLTRATLIAGIIALVGNRIFAVAAGVWWRVPAMLLLVVLISLDLLQIPFYYWIYDHSSALLARCPARLRTWFEKDWGATSLGRRASSLGGFGVMLVAALPTLGGGIWSATFIAYGLRLRRRTSYAWLSMGSLLSYFVLYMVLGTLITAARYFF